MNTRAVKIVLPMLSVLALAGCNTRTADQSLTHDTAQAAPTRASVGHVSETSSATPSSSQVTKKIVRARRVAPSFVSLPNSRLTPGAISPNVTQANIHSTICVSGYSSGIRPPSTYTTSLKRQQLDAGYNHRGDLVLSDYEEDHLISLELGGSPTSVKNLWPEYLAGSGGAHMKDRLENRLHALVCAGTLSLTTAQHAIATNWWAALQRYGTATASATDTYIAPTVMRTHVSTASCTTTSTGSCIRAGEFCRNADEGRTGTDAGGETLKCEDKHWHHV